MFKQAGVVGVELDTGVIRAVELKGKPGKAKLVMAGLMEIPQEAVVDGSVVQVSEVSEALGRLWAEAKFGSRKVVLGTFNQNVITRMIAFPKVPEAKLDQAIRLHAQEYFPIPLSQMIMDYAVVGEVQGNNGPELEILLVAAKTSSLEKGIAALQDSGLKPVVIDASPLALLRVLPEEKLTGTVAVVDISHGQSSLLMAVDGVPRYARLIPVSLKQYTDQLGLTLKDVSVDEQVGENEPFVAAGGEPAQAFNNWALAAAAEIRSTINYFVKQDSWPEVSSLYLSGPGARIPMLPELLQDELGLVVEVFRPLDKVAASEKKRIDRQVAKPDFAISVGLALRGLEG